MLETARTTPPGTPPRQFSVPAGQIADSFQPRAPTPPVGSEEPPAEPTVPDGSQPEWVREDVDIMDYQKPAKRKHRKVGGEKMKPGKLSWVWGTKLVFFTRRKEQWLKAEEGVGGAGGFYTKMARLYVLKYPREMLDTQDLQRDIPDPPDHLADRVVNEAGLSPEEVKFRSEFHRKLREKIGAWYRREFGSLVNAAKKDFVKLFSGTLSAAPPKPGRPQLMHFYSRKFYDERIKDHFISRTQSLKRRAEFSGEAEPEPLAILHIVTKEAWEDETLVFQEEVKIALEKEYQTAVVGWKASLADSPTRTPEEMAATLANAAFYLQPFVDAIYERFGMVASVLIAGPVGKNGGAIGMQSVHAGTTKGLAQLSWPLHDKLSFGDVERSMVAFARECYSDAECRARAVSSTTADVNVAATSTPANLTSERGNQSAGPREGFAQGWAERAGLLRMPSIEGETNGVGGEGAGAGMDDDGNAVAGDDSGAAGGDGVEADDARRSGDGSESAGGEGTGAGPGGDGDGARAVEADTVTVLQRKVDAIWVRDDRDEWSYDMGRAHVGFERGKAWGLDWARCVNEFYNFEALHGWDEIGKGKVATEGRPAVLSKWFVRQRIWWSPMPIGVIGGVGQEGTWVDIWWKWWKGMQPAERTSAEDELTLPEEADWTEMGLLFGRNGFMLIMATLLWWGDAVVGKGDPMAEMQWERAVADVEWVLQQLQVKKPVEKRKPVAKKAVKGKAKKRGHTEVHNEDEEPAQGEDEEDDGRPAAKKARTAKKNTVPQDAKGVTKRTTRTAAASEGRQTRARTNGKAKEPAPTQKKKAGKRS